ncbi:MAG: peptidylprolyl isomerase [Bdellovibrionota bacterium]
MKNAKEIRLYHILVTHKYEAEDLLRLLREGESFFELAKKFSTCSSAKNSGNLGEIEEKKLDEDFKEAADDLSIGETSKTPVRTRFGYHIIMKLQK